MEAASGADVVYTDAWASMGQEAEKEERQKVFLPYQVNCDLFAHAKYDAAFHALSAGASRRRGYGRGDRFSALGRVPAGGEPVCTRRRQSCWS